MAKAPKDKAPKRGKKKKAGPRPNPGANPGELMGSFTKLAQEAADQGQKMLEDFIAANSGGFMKALDPLNITPVFVDFTRTMLTNPEGLMTRQMDFLADYWRLMDASRYLRTDGEETIDKRFRGEGWREGPFQFFKQFYLMASQHILDMVAEAGELDEAERQKVTFYTRQFLDAVSPSNFALTNPEVLQATIDSHGENLVKGMQNLLEDIRRGQGLPMVKMTDLDAFTVGENLAITPGKVVFRNKLFELIQYAPSTDKVYATPLLIFPPWINKFYILDLTQEKSFVRWAVSEGYTVFMVSWVNPDASYKDYGMEEYLHQGYLEALRVVREITGQANAHTIGYCVAGTMLAATMAYLEAKGEADQIKTATFLTAQVDFENAGELTVFIDEQQLDAIDKMMEQKGFLDKKAMALTFNALRSNDLIWSYVVNNYLLGRTPHAFDLLYWNSDSTNLSRKMHREYLDQMYRQNNLAKPGRVKLDGVKLDLTRIKTPIYVQAGRQDHIAPPDSVFKILPMVAGEKRFVLAGSGHIAGVVNPPAAKKYQYWTGDSDAKNLEAFLETAKETTGSWWPDWSAWLKPRSGRKRAARTPGDGPYKALCDAPGEYVLHHGED